MRKFLLIIFLAFFSCKKEPDCVNPNADPEQIFDCTYLIEIPTYTYHDTIDGQDTVIVIYGDTMIDKFLPPNDPEVPIPQPFYESFTKNFVIKWQEPSVIKLQTAAIFRKPIESTSDGLKKILNPEDIVWLWYSGLGSNNENVSRNDGELARLDDSGNIIPLPSFTFNPDSLYYLGLWGWDDAGEKIIYSSKQIRMRISE